VAVGIVVSCPSCKYTSKVPQEYAGREVICPQCGNALRVPAAAAPAGSAPGPSPTPGASGKNCPRCERSISAAATVCIWCGTPQEAGSAAVIPTPSEGLSPDASRACPYCAETIKAAARKCPHCGEILDAQLAATRRSQERVSVRAGRDLDKQARDAFLISLFSIFCCPIILGPISIIQGANVNKALSQMGKPHNGLATAAIILGIISLVLMLIWIFVSQAMPNLN